MNKTTSNLIANHIPHIGGVMVSGVFSRLKNSQVLNPIVVFSLIYVMNDFVISKISPYAFLHHKPMFQHVPKSIIGMIGSISSYVAFGSLNLSTSPIIRFFSSLGSVSVNGSTRVGTELANSLLKISPFYQKIFMTRITLKKIIKSISLTRNFGLYNTVHLFRYDTKLKGVCQ